MDPPKASEVSLLDVQNLLGVHADTLKQRRWEESRSTTFKPPSVEEARTWHRSNGVLSDVTDTELRHMLNNMQRRHDNSQPVDDIILPPSVLRNLALLKPSNPPDTTDSLPPPSVVVDADQLHAALQATARLLASENEEQTLPEEDWITTEDGVWGRGGEDSRIRPAVTINPPISSPPPTAATPATSVASTSATSSTMAALRGLARDVLHWSPLPGVTAAEHTRIILFSEGRGRALAIVILITAIFLFLIYGIIASINFTT